VSARATVVDVFLILGVVLVLVSCLGTLVFRGVHDRLHYGAPCTLGATCIAVAVVVKESFSVVGDKAILLAVFLLLATPIVTHAVGRAARTEELDDWRLGPDEQIEIEERTGR
jgi:multicomponent Na+:H+ antiporter subunit G